MDGRLDRGGTNGMVVTEVRISLSPPLPGHRRPLLAFAVVVFNGYLEVPDFKVVRHAHGPRAFPPERRARMKCPSCLGNTQVGFRWCQRCGSPIPEPISRAGALAAGVGGAPRYHFDACTLSGPLRAAVEEAVVAEYRRAAGAEGRRSA